MRPLILSIFSILVGCVATHPDAGSGPLVLTPGVEEFFQKYLSTNSPEYFAVSLDGASAGSTSCAAMNCQGGGPAQAIQYCLIKSRGQDCKIYAVGRSIVWERGTQSSARPVTIAPVKAPAPTIDERIVILTWGDKPLVGTIRNDAQGAGAFSVQLTGSSTCGGSMKMQDERVGAWALACPDGTTATGKFFGAGDGKGGRGEGKDQTGRNVVFTVGPRR